jgi:dTDP-4-amino-4,6-dideoxygalactose transaminase
MEFDIPFSGRSHTYSDREIAIAVEVMRTSDPLTQGVHLRNFEKNFQLYTRAKHAFAVSNATAALEIAAQLCQLSPADEVIIPSHTFTSSAYPFARMGARLVWADIDPDTRVVTCDSLGQCISDATKVIVVPHLYGYGAEMPEIIALAKSYDLLVVEDAAQSLGVNVSGQMTGTFGDFGVFSFHSHKNVTTLGEGGMLVVRDPKIAELIPMLRHNGHCVFPFDRSDYWVPAMGNVDFPEYKGERLWPTNCCIGELECALGSKLLERADLINMEKRERAIKWIDSLNDYPELVFHRVNNDRHNYHLLVAHVKDNLRDAFIRRMAYHHKIQCVVQYCPLDRYPFYEKLGFGKSECPHTDEFFDNMVSFPFNHWLSESQLDRMLSATYETLDHLREG